MFIRYIYHSGIVVEGDGFSLLFDYYRDTPDGYVKNTLLKRPVRMYVFASHSHGDHFNNDVMSFADTAPDTRYILSYDIKQTLRNASATSGNPITYLSPFETYSDDMISVKAYGSTDLGVSFAVSAGGKRIFHAGDLNNWHWQDESTPDEIAVAENAFHTELDKISVENPAFDVACFPVDSRQGSDYARGAREFLAAVKVGLFCPIHFSSDPRVVAEFAPIAAQAGARYAEFDKVPGTCDF